MNNRTKILSVFLALLLAVGVVAVTPLSASAAEAEAAPTAAVIDQAYPDFEYDVRYDGTAEITRYTGEGGDVTIPSTIGGYTVTSISPMAFYGCTSITSVIIPGSVKSIEKVAFSGCAGLTSVFIPDSVAKIGNYAFSGCINLTSISIPDSVADLGYRAFASCLSLKSVIIGSSVTCLDDEVFAECTSLTDVTIPDTVTYIEKDAFNNTPWLENLFDSQPEGLMYAGKVLIGVKGNCPDEVEVKPGTVGIGSRVFSYYDEENPKIQLGYDNLKSVILPDSLKNIGNYAFYGCTGLTSIDIPGSVTSIGNLAFGECTNLSDIIIPDTVTDIDIGAFNHTAWYENQPDGLVYAGKVAYKMKGDCPAEVELAPGTTGIAGDAFGSCGTLNSVIIPDSVLSIGRYAFSSCPELKSVIIPKTVIHIGDLAFGINWRGDGYSYTKGFKVFGYKGSEAEHYSKGVKITFVPLDKTTPSEDRNDFSYAFVSDGTIEITGYNGADSEITIPSSIYGYAVTGIGGDAFRNYTNLTSVTIPNSVTSIGEFAFYGCTSLTSINIPDSVTSIVWGAFSGCTNLESVTIPDSVTSIANKAFGYYYDDDWNTLKIDGFTIYGYEGSEAERYAVDNDFTFVPIKSTPDESTPDEATPDESTPDEATPDEATPDEATPDEAILGDVDGDGEVTVNDATYIQRKIADIAIPFEIDDAAADADEDGQVTLMDATYIQRWLIKLKSNDNIGNILSAFDPDSYIINVSGKDFCYYDQTQCDYPYGDDTIAYSGSAPACFAMIASTIKRKSITPVEAVEWCGNDYYVYGIGTMWSYFEAAGDHFGIGFEGQTGDIGEAVTALKKGKYVISSHGPGRFTKGGHFIVMAGVDTDGNIIVCDPNGTNNYVGTPFTVDEIDESATSFWIFDKKYK